MVRVRFGYVLIAMAVMLGALFVMRTSATSDLAAAAEAHTKTAASGAQIVSVKW